MGCVHSRVDKEETVVRCRERRRLMKQLVRCRGELASAYLGYLQSLRNTGATLRQFVEDGPGGTDNHSTTGMPQSPLPLPPSPPPPPIFSPDSRRDENLDDEMGGENKGNEAADVIEVLAGDDEDVDIEHRSSCDLYAPPPPPPPPPHSLDQTWESSWNHICDHKSCSTPSSPGPLDSITVAPLQELEDETWAETNTEFADGEQDWEEGNGETEDGLVMKPLLGKLPGPGDVLGEDNSSAVSWFTKDSDMAVIVWRNKKTLAGIVKQLDDYFLKASEGGTEVVAILESNKSRIFRQNIACKNGKKTKSAKVFSSLSWRWSSRSPLLSKDAFGIQSSGEFHETGNHHMTLDKIFSAEQKLYTDVKEEEMTKLYQKRKTALLLNEESGEQNRMRTEKIRSNIQELDNEIRQLQESINETCLSISKLRDDELFPQLSSLSSGLLHLWRTMYECHQVQNHISQQTHHLRHHLSTEPTNDSHLNATVQLEAEVTSWHIAFLKVLQCQREYAQTLNQWVKLTDCLPDSSEMLGPSGIYALCDEWQLALDRLTDKVAGEAIKSFISSIHSVSVQLAEEQKLHRKLERLKKKLEKQTNRLCKTENKCDDTSTEDPLPMSTKQTNLDALKKRIESEKVKYSNSVCTSRTMMLNSLQTGLPNVFQAMTVFAGMCMQAFEGVHHHSIAGDDCNTNCTSPM